MIINDEWIKQMLIKQKTMVIKHELQRNVHSSP